MIALFFLLLSVILVYSMLTSSLGSHEALSSEVRNIIEKKRSLWLVVKNVILYSPVNNIMWLFIGFFVGIGSLIAISSEVLHINDSLIAIIIPIVVTTGGLFFSVGLISVLRREFPGYLHLEGISAVIAGWIFILAGVMSLFLLVVVGH